MAPWPAVIGSGRMRFCRGAINGALAHGYRIPGRINAPPTTAPALWPMRLLDSGHMRFCRGAIHGALVRMVIRPGAH